MPMSLVAIKMYECSVGLFECAHLCGCTFFCYSFEMAADVHTTYKESTYFDLHPGVSSGRRAFERCRTTLVAAQLCCSSVITVTDCTVSTSRDHSKCSCLPQHGLLCSGQFVLFCGRGFFFISFLRICEILHENRVRLNDTNILA